MPLMSDYMVQIEKLISRDPGGRNIGRLVQPGHLAEAARSLLGAKKVLVVTGFPVASAGVGETDGPPGALALGRAVAALDIPVAYLTDSVNAPLLKAVGAEPLLTYAPDLLDRERFSHLVAVERPGRAEDGSYYNMFGRPIDHLVEPVDELFLQAPRLGLTTVGVGDGGNEVGMGLVRDLAAGLVNNGDKIVSTVATDFLITAGVSNWGAWGLAAALSVLSGRDLLPGVDQATEAVRAVLEAGGVDGVTGEAAMKVDGMTLDRHDEILTGLQDIVARSMAK